MNTNVLALQLMALQGLMGAFDTLYHHELTVALPRTSEARRELSIHATRSLIYSTLFIGLAGWRFDGLWSVLLLAVFVVETVLTLWDFVVEDQTRLLPATERVTHTLLAMNGGAFCILLFLNLPAMVALPTALVWQPHGALSVFLALCGVGVAVSGVRDAFAARALGRRQAAMQAHSGPRFGSTESSVLVTGATGFIGQKLVRALLADGHRVTVLSRSPRAASWLFDGRVDCVRSFDQLPLWRCFDVVVNLAGARVIGWRWSPARRRTLRSSRVALTERLVAWIGAAEHKPAQLLSASAIGYYGIQSPGDATLLDELAAPQPIFMSELSCAWEQSAGAAAAHGVVVTFMRFGIVLGQQGALPMMLLPVKLGLGGPLGDGRQWVSWIHVDDVIGAIAHLWRKGASGAFNFTAPDSVTQASFSRVAATVHRRPWGFPTPALPMRLALGEQAGLLLDGQRVVPARLQADGFAFAHPSLAGALASLA